MPHYSEGSALPSQPTRDDVDAQSDPGIDQLVQESSFRDSLGEDDQTLGFENLVQRTLLAARQPVDADTPAEAPQEQRHPTPPRETSFTNQRRDVAASALAEAGSSTDRRSAATGVLTGPLRRVPVQPRSVARVNRMLDACAQLVDEVGYDGLTTTLIGERAGVAIGSVYQFFPDKRAIVQAVTLRNLEAYLQRLSSRLSQEQSTHWWDAVDAVIDEYIAMYRTTPAFRTQFGDAIDVHLLDNERDNNAVVAARIAALLEERYELATGRTEFALRVAFEAAGALIKLAFQQAPTGDVAVLDEARTLIKDYLHRKVS